MSAPPISRIPRLVPRRDCLKRTPSAPSKLELLREQYHQQILREKEEVLMKRFRERQESVIQRMRAAFHGQHINNMESRGQRKCQNVFDYNGRPMGRDKSTLLTPINLTAKHPSVENNSTLPLVAHVPQPPPFKQKPAVVRQNRSVLKQHSSPLMSTEQPNNINENNQRINVSYRNNCMKNDRNRTPTQLDGTKETVWRTSPVDMLTLTPFQKWQMLQQKQKEKRLEKYREMQTGSAHNTADFAASKEERRGPLIPTPPNNQLKRENSLRSRQKKGILRRQNSEHRDMETDKQSSCAKNNPRLNNQQESPLDGIQRKERELIALIKKEQDELISMQKMNDEDEADYDDEDEAMGKENRYIASRNDRRQRLRAASRRAETMSEYGEQPISRNNERHGEQTPFRNDTGHTEQPLHSGHSQTNHHRTVVTRPTPPPPVKQFTVDPTKEGTAFYIKKSSTAEAMCTDINMAECNICGRTFAADRLARHTNICEKNSKKKTKVFDLVKMRTEGTDQAKYVKYIDSQPPPKKKTSTWRQKHEDLISSLQHARESSQLVAEGKRPLPAPPTHNPDYVQCDSCGRRFNQAAAERHVPHCRSSKTRPGPPPGGYRRQR